LNVHDGLLLLNIVHRLLLSIHHLPLNGDGCDGDLTGRGGTSEFGGNNITNSTCSSSSELGCLLHIVNSHNLVEQVGHGRVHRLRHIDNGDALLRLIMYVVLVPQI